MCTVCGHYARPNPIISTDIYDMLKKMAHRGPDTHGIYLDGKIHRGEEVDDFRKTLLQSSRIALGHSRLRIVGLENLTQPFASCDGRLTLIHNGEIYNYLKLKTLLSQEHEIDTSSDSEVLVHLLEEIYRGDLPEAVRRLMGLLDGMYVLAVTDGDRLVVARDFIGKKPLYFVENEGVTYFASEKKALWNDRFEPSRLEPGHLLIMDSEGTRTREGVSLPKPQIDVVDFREAVESYNDALTQAVHKRLVGLHETHLGVIFSGGVDSVLISKLLQREGKNIICYCTGTEVSGDVRAARSVARDLGLQLRTTIIDEAVIEEILPEVIRRVEESGLLQVEVAIPMYFAAQMAAEDGIRVMFTGQAADELFAGYPWYSDVLAESGYLHLHQKLWEDLNLLSSDTLEREDKVTMAHSIELRAPYLDRDVIQTAMRISPRLKIEGVDDRERKRVHRQAAVELGVPPYLALRAKDPAQSGSGIHEIIRKLAHRNGQNSNQRLATENARRDRGSLYRYGERTYGDDVARCYLEEIHKSIERQYTSLVLAG